MDDGAGIAVFGTLACRGTEVVCIRVVNFFSISPGPPSIGGKFAFLGTVAQPNPDIRRRRVVITAWCVFVIRINTLKINDI
jgi:hypothetical protein